MSSSKSQEKDGTGSVHDEQRQPFDTSDLTRIPQPNPWRQKVATSHNLLAIHHLLRNQPPDLGSVPQDDSKPFDTAD